MVRCWARCVAVADRGCGRNNDSLAFRTLRRQRGLRGACRAIGEVVVASQVPRLRGRARRSSTWRFARLAGGDLGQGVWAESTDGDGDGWPVERNMVEGSLGSM